MNKLFTLLDSIDGSFNDNDTRRMIREFLENDADPATLASLIVEGLQVRYPEGNWRVDAALDVLYAHGGARIGIGATMHGYSDAYAYTVIDRNEKGTVLTLQRDKATLDPNFKPDFIPGGFAGHVTNNRSQVYSYERDPGGETVKVRLRKDGRFYVAGSTRPVTIGKRYEFYDYNF